MTVKPKLVFTPFEKITANPEKNPARFVGGLIHGVSVVDNRDIEGMMLGLLSRPEPGIERALSAIKRGDVLDLFGGFRRHGAVEAFMVMGLDAAVAKFSEGTIAGQEKVKALFESFKKIPVNIFDTTGSEEGDAKFILSLGNDQDQAPYQASGLLNAVWALQAAGAGLGEISESHGLQILNLTPTGRSKIAELRSEKNLTERTKKTKQALKGRLDDEWLATGKLGEWVKKALFIKVARQDGLTDEVPAFDANRSTIAKLAKAKAQDGADWHPERGGATFNAVMDTIIAEKNAEDDDNGTTRVVKPKADVLSNLLNSTKSEAVRQALQFTQGVIGSSPQRVQAADHNAYRMELVVATWLKRKAEIKNPDVAQILSDLFIGDPLTFEAALARYI